MEFSGFVNDAHFLVVIWNNLNEAAHYIREESHSTKHYEHSKKPLQVTDRIEISKANSG